MKASGYMFYDGIVPIGDTVYWKGTPFKFVNVVKNIDTSYSIELNRENSITNMLVPAEEVRRFAPDSIWDKKSSQEIQSALDGEPKSTRFNSGKTQVREIDPAFIMGIGEVLTASRQKYDEGNWQKETLYSTPYESAMRHLMKFWSGEEVDEETGKHHLLHCATNLMFLYYHTSSGKGIDNRLFKKGK